MPNSKTKKYLAIYKGRTTVIEAINSYEAQLQAGEYFQATKKYMIAVRSMDSIKKDNQKPS